MNFEPKKTDKAAFVALWHNNELLVLQSRKWRSEGTPYLLPGGGCKENETLEECLVRELEEEIGEIYEDYSLFKLFGRHDTKWSNCHIFELFEPEAKHQSFFGVMIEPKLYGFEWWNFQEDKARIQALKPFMMPGLRWYLEQKGLL